ncbi:hypothetical protein JHK87_006893 [Glycine soja]|nr:hypothetical protein JHK87_006893 [Glycine soja]
MANCSGEYMCKTQYDAELLPFRNTQFPGPSWNVGLSKRDSTTASKDSATTDIPSLLMDLSALISAFSNKGFNTKEMVSLSGAHTTRQARYQLFRGRVYNESNIESNFATSLSSQTVQALVETTTFPHLMSPQELYLALLISRISSTKRACTF